MISKHAILFLCLAVLLFLASFFIDGWPAIGVLVAAFGFTVSSWMFERHRRRGGLV